MRSDKADTLRSRLDIIAENLFLGMIKDKSLREQISLLLVYYCGMRAEDINKLKNENIVIQYDPPFLITNGRVYFLKGLLVDKIKQFRDTDNGFTTEEYSFQYPSLHYTPKARNTWVYAIRQAYPK